MLQGFRSANLRLGPAVLALLLLLASAAGGETVGAGAAASPGDPAGGRTLVTETGVGASRPRILGHCEPRTHVRIAAALRVASQRVRDLPTCAAMFTSLGASGVDRLGLALYRSSARVDGERVCNRGRGAAAFTVVGSPVTTVCPAFDRLTVFQGAVVVLHEALHAAGRTEWPLDPEAPNSGEIDRMISLACEL